MVYLFLILVCFVTSCSTATKPDVRADLRAAADSQGAPQTVVQARVGVEFMPHRIRRSPWQPDSRTRLAQKSEIQVETRDPRAVPRERMTASADTAEAKPAPRYEFSRERVRSIDNPIERMTLRFIGDMLETERERLRHHHPTPRLTSALRRLTSAAMPSPLDEQIAEDEAARVQELRGSLLNKPMRHALKEAFLIHEFELVLDSMKADHVPLSAAWQDAHPTTPGFGRISLRVRPTSDDPLEIAYIRRQWRLATSSETLKVTYKQNLLPGLDLHMRANYNYQDRSLNLYGDLVLQLEKRSHLHVLGGNSMDLLTGNNMFPVLESPLQLKSEERSAALLFYVEHTF